ncbi:MAG: DUF1192 family protein [Lachnospiraceae bacterium]|nr:DUF1192 family protein [Lachnospiraceae bacterium]
MSETLKVNVPNDIKRMTIEELDIEIARLEAEARRRREAKAKEQSSKTSVMA